MSGASSGSRLVPCGDCGRPVSPRAWVCPGCGRTLRTRLGSAARGIGLFLAGLWLLGSIGAALFLATAFFMAMK